MEPAREPAWAEHEKLYLLAEILKASPVPSHVLFTYIRESNIQPQWNDIALPHGRSLRSCQMAYNELAASDYRRPQLPAPSMHYSGSDIPKKRQHQPESTPALGRLLQPRPPHSYPGDYVSGPAYGAAMSPVGEPANKKKRGRPTKAEAQQRAQEAAARGEVYPPPRKARTSIPAAEPPQGEARTHMRTPPGAAPAVPAGAMTPQQTHAEPNPDSSSGKKKRSRPTPLALEKTQSAPTEAESPIAYGSAAGDPNRSLAYSSFTPISAPLLSSSEPGTRDVRMEGVEESQPRTTTPHSFKDTVGI